MSRTVTIVTAENIRVTYPLAGIAPRFIAALIDLFLQLLLLMGALEVMQVVGRLGGPLAPLLAGFVTTVGLVVNFLILFVYAVFFEMLWGGRTPGKRLLGLRVIHDGGLPITLLGSAIRNVLRFIDFGVIPISPVLIFFGLPGLLSIFFSPLNKRIGDYAAGTLVIVEMGASPFAGGERERTSTASVRAFLPLVRNLDRLTLQEYQMIRRFTSRRGDLELPVQAAIGERIARPLLERLEIQVVIDYQLQFVDVLEAIEQKYAEDRGIL